MRWEICFNLSVLRMLSYALDLHWRRRQAAPPLQQHGASRRTQPDPARTADAHHVVAPIKGVCPTGLPTDPALWRQQTPLPSEDEYGLLPYLAYILYAPLYLAGPIITFQDFAWQLRQRSPPNSQVVGVCCVHMWHMQLGLLCTTAFSDRDHCPEHFWLLQILKYAARLAADWVCLELLTHYLYFNSIAKHHIGLRYRQYGLQYGTIEMGKCNSFLLS
jgi:hypothetical protein